MKKKILLCNEASYMATGFGTYGYEVMRRLHATGKYELAEFASYGGTEYNDDLRYRQLPWKFYPNLPQNDEEKKKYNKDSIDQFGAWKFESVAASFQPDIVFDFRDWWMFEHQERSPLRKYFKWLIMPTVDAYPQDDQWISTFMNADGVLAYSDWGLEVLRKQSNNAIKLVGTASPGINLSSYILPQDKAAHKEAMGISREWNIVGTVMRNQSRKLYPDLIDAFALFLKNAPADVAKKTYLYMHCCYPDIGWDIPRLIKEAGIADKTIFTYICENCKVSFPAFYQDVVGFCRNCGQPRAIMPRTQFGVDTKKLGEIMACFDAYVQYATSEGFGMPQVEAAACGVTVFAVDYSAMSDVVRKIKGIPIKVQRLYREPETHCYRALPDNNDLVARLIEYFRIPEQERKELAISTRQAAQTNYNWDTTAATWEACFDAISVLPREQTWLSPANIFQPNQKIPQGLNNEEFVRWGLTNIAGRPDLTNSYMALRMIRDLNWGATQGGMGGKYHNEASSLGHRTNSHKFDRNTLVKVFVQMCNEHNFWEQQRIAVGG